MWLCKTDNGWRRFPVVYGKNGRIKPGVVILDKKSKPPLEGHFPEGHFEIRYYEGRVARYRNVGTHAADAIAALKKHVNVLAAEEAASKAGVKLEETPGRQTLRDALDAFLQATADRGHAVAEHEYRRTCGEFLKSTNKRFVDELEQEDVLKFYRQLRADGYADRTVLNKHIHVAAFMRSAGIAATKIPKPPRYEKTLPEVYSKGELDKFFASLKPGSRDELSYRMFQQLGLREQEAANAVWGQVDWNGPTFRVRGNPRTGFKVKDSEQRDVPIPADLLKLLEAYKKNRESGLILATKRGNVDGHLLRTLKRLAYKAGLHCESCGGCNGKNRECERWYLHRFRANYATTMLRNGVDARTVMSLMGHSDMETVLKYLRPAEGEELRGMVNAVQW